MARFNPILLLLLGSSNVCLGFTPTTLPKALRVVQRVVQHPITSAATPSSSSSSSSSSLFNVPPKSTSDTDPASLKDAANREPPPQSFYQLGVNSVRAAELAIQDGNKLIEIEVRP